MIASIFAAALLALNGSTFVVKYDDKVPADARRDFGAAAAIWSKCLVSDAPIRIHVSWIDRGPTGFATMRPVRNEPHLPMKNVWYASALANALAGQHDSEEDDMNIFLLSRANWYYDSETPIAEDQTDFINVAVHEIAHGIGISSTAFVPWQGDPIGQLGLPNEFISFFDYTFELPELDGTPSQYDAMIRLADGRTLMDFPNPSLALKRAIENPTLHFKGETAIAANDGFPVGVTPGNISHIPAASGAPTPIMLGNSGIGESIRQPDPILIGMLMDLGWEFAEACRPVR